MQSLSEFTTLAEAQAYEHTTYTVIKASDAKSFFIRKGVEDTLHSNMSNATVVNTGEADITIGSICRGALANTTGFNVDPSVAIGASNRGMLSLLVGVGVISQAIMDEFIAQAETKTKPYENKTEHDFQVAKGTVTKKPAQLSALGESVIITVTADAPEIHNPRITTVDGQQVALVRNVKVAGLYVATVPNDKRGVELLVDNYYGVIE